MILAVATLAAYLHDCAPTISSDTMRAIVLVESHGYSYAINDNSTRTTYCVPGGRVFPCTRQQAAAIATAAVGSGDSVDVGLAQVNSANFRKYRIAATDMLEPCSNLQVGSSLLANAYRDASARFSDQREALRHAIMAYNTGSLYAGERYLREVVSAALDSEKLPTVPSIALLKGHAAAASPQLRVVRGALTRRRDMSQDPRSAPLLVARSLALPTARSDLRESLMPALSR